MLERFTWFRQSAYRWRGDGLTVDIDPWGVTDPGPADVILITHAHSDHFDPESIEQVRGERTAILAPADVANELTGKVTSVEPGGSYEVAGVKVQAVPAYNIAPDRLDLHPKANRWVGYIIELAGSTYYHAGDTDHVPELNELRTDVAFVPIGGTYTMDVDEAVGLVKTITPRLAVPMHYGFVVGTLSDAERFRDAASPVEVELLDPTNPFEVT